MRSRPPWQVLTLPVSPLIFISNMPLLIILLSPFEIVLPVYVTLWEENVAGVSSSQISNLSMQTYFQYCISRHKRLSILLTVTIPSLVPICSLEANSCLLRSAAAALLCLFCHWHAHCCEQWQSEWECSQGEQQMRKQCGPEIALTCTGSFHISSGYRMFNKQC